MGSPGKTRAFCILRRKVQNPLKFWRMSSIIVGSRRNIVTEQRRPDHGGNGEECKRFQDANEMTMSSAL
jgi:hypothetical protein